MDFSEVIEPIKKHPYVLLGGTAAVLLFLYFRASTTSTPAPGASSGVTTLASDPNALALQAQQDQNSTQLSLANIQAQTQQSYIQAMADVQKTSIASTLTATENTNATQLAASGLKTQTNLAAIAASIFPSAANALSTNYQTQLAANATGSTPFGATSGVANGTWLVPGGPGWEPWFNNIAHSGATVPIVNGGNDSGSGVINTANTQLEQMFNNVIRAGQGASPLETSIITDPNANAGTARIDPIFLNWVPGQNLPTITDVTPGANNAFGYTGSVYDPSTGQSHTIG